MVYLQRTRSFAGLIQPHPEDFLSTHRIHRFLFLLTFEGLLAVVLTLATPSEAASAFWMGYSKPRLAQAAIGMTGTLLLAGTALFGCVRPARFQNACTNVRQWLAKNDHLMTITLSLGAIALLAAWSFLFTWLFVPAPLRWMLAWVVLAAGQALLLLKIDLPDLYREKHIAARLFNLPRLNHLEANQQQVFKVLTIIGLLYWAVFIIPNLQESDAHTLQFFGGDEGIIYPVFTHMFAPAETFRQGMYHFFLYEDYHYGFPFYFLSAMIVLPLHWISGGRLNEFSQMGLLLLRQFISVAPLVLSAGVLVWLQTRLRSLWKAAALFGLLLIIPEVVNYNIRFWHPDGLTTLCVVLTLFFLDRDRLSLGTNFYLAAAFCGLASSLRLYGFFFGLAIPFYLITTRVRANKSWGTVIRHALGFVGMMLAVFVLTSPYLLDNHARNQAVAVLFSKTDEFANGYAGIQDPDGIFQMGLEATLKWVSYPYAPPAYLLFLLTSLVSACLFGKQKFLNRIIILWILPLAAYLIWFVAVRSSHYWLPLMLPLYSAAFGLDGALEEIALPGWAQIAGRTALGLALVGLAGTSIYLIFTHFI